jgi:hypothetical protein
MLHLVVKIYRNTFASESTSNKGACTLEPS